MKMQSEVAYLAAFTGRKYLYVYDTSTSIKCIPEIYRIVRDTLLPKLMSGEIRVPLETNEN